MMTRNRYRPTGFNFAEVLFAVMILAIGFIMIAALFPVALRQTQLNGEEVVASTTARSGTNFLEQAGLSPNALPATVQTAQATPEHPANAPVRMVANPTPIAPSLSVPGVVYSFRDRRVLDPDGTGPLTANGAQVDLWKQVNGNLILPADNRSAFVALYRRGVTYTNPVTGPPLPHTDPAVVASPHAYIQVFIIGVQQRNRSTYEPAKDYRRFPNDVSAPIGAANLPATLEPKMVYVKLKEGVANPDRLMFYDSPANNAPLVDNLAAAEGAFVIISDDQFTHVNPGDPDQDTSTTVIEQNGQSNGRIYRLATQIGTGTWELAPGWDMKYDDGVDNNVGTVDDIHENIPPHAVNAPLPANTFPAIAFMVGRGYVNPETPADGYEGGAQETGVYTTFVQAN